MKSPDPKVTELLKEEHSSFNHYTKDIKVRKNTHLGYIIRPVTNSEIIISLTSEGTIFMMPPTKSCEAFRSEQIL